MQFLKVTFHLHLLQNIDIPCAVQYIRVTCLTPIVCTSHSHPDIAPYSSPQVITSSFSVSSFFVVVFTGLLYFKYSICKWYHAVFIFLWLISLSIMPYKSIHVVANGKISFFFIAEYCSIVCMYHICSVHSSADGQLGCFHALATVNHAAMNIRIHVSFHIELLGVFLFCFFWIYTKEWNFWVM